MVKYKHRLSSGVINEFCMDGHLNPALVITKALPWTVPSNVLLTLTSCRRIATLPPLRLRLHLSCLVTSQGTWEYLDMHFTFTFKLKQLTSNIKRIFILNSLTLLSFNMRLCLSWHPCMPPCQIILPEGHASHWWHWYNNFINLCASAVPYAFFFTI